MHFECVDFYVAGRYVHLTKEEIEEDLFVIDEYEEEDEVLPVLELPLLVEQRVWGVEILDLPYLASGHNLNLAYEDMDDLRRQVVSADNNDYPAT